jgi:outer membrane protein TolC
MRLIATTSFLLLTACTTQPRYERPAVELPATWKEVAPRFAEDGRWWRIYQDAELEQTVEEALAGNADLLVAAARVDEARALLSEAQSFFFPRLDAQAARVQRLPRDAERFLRGRSLRAPARRGASG